ncbi:cold-shock protein [Cellulomonas edaphi]|uniref:Cold shock domain-containing protein n=1 Tax=Cellulomonas edaphi TaxID=3053468 RepID=A0ABT7S302_9CELL|nr:cold shock domain-containing protein [Cellulomons edaphi]MDM7829914.1 cold shock domain-containing protein [Cellulomons edaphi]
MPEGTVRWFDAERGFGFLALDDEGGEDLFVHASEIVGDDGPRVLREGQVVEFEIGTGDRGPQARRVRVTGDHPSGAALGLLGTVSWYEPGKGYGFVMPDGGGAEIFLHSSAIVGGGVVSEGQRVAFLVVDGERGPQADHLLPLGAQAAPQAAPDGADGTVTWYDADKGFGFVSPDSGGEDVFVHARSLAGGLSELAEGDRVTFDVAEGDRGLQARDVRLVGAPARRGGRAAPDRDRPGRSRETGGGGVRGGEGVVARYDADRGFGFITPDAGGADLFVHVSVVRGAEVLEAGDRVRFTVRQSDRGPQADRVELL